MGTRAEVLRRIDGMTGRLSSPLLPADLANGWTEESRLAILDLFNRLRLRLISDEPLTEKDKQLSISRGMDFWGITGGDLLEEGAEISGQIRELKD